MSTQSGAVWSSDDERSMQQARRAVLMSRAQVADTIQSFVESVLSGPKVAGTSVVLVLSAIWMALTSVLAVALAALFFCDVFLGSSKAIHRSLVTAQERAGYGQDRLNGFEWPRFWKAWIKMGAAIAGIAVFSLGDILLHSSGVPETWHPLTNTGLMAMCWGFFSSSLGSLGYFFPQAREALGNVFNKLAPGIKPISSGKE